MRGAGDESRMVTRLICEGSWRREYAAGSCGKEEKKKQNSGGSLVCQCCCCFGEATSRGEENKSEGGASGELPAVVGEKPKTSGGRLCMRGFRFRFILYFLLMLSKLP